MINRDAVRLKTGDKSQLEREESVGDGSITNYKLGHEPIISPSSLQVWVNGTAQTLTTDYTVNESFGVVTFVSAPAANSTIVFQYYWAVFSDDEVDYFLTEGGDNVTLACVKLLLALAADAAKIAMRETMSGGGGMGSVTRDTSLTAQELRETANVLYKQYSDESGSTYPADGITEVIWTTHMDVRMAEEDFYRD